MTNENKTSLRLEVDKTIQPKQYEPIKIMVDIAETFYWEDEEDRQKKMKSHTNKLTSDFISVFDHVVKEIGEEDRCIGRVVTSGDVPKKGIDKVESDTENADDTDDTEWHLD